MERACQKEKRRVEYQLQKNALEMLIGTNSELNTHNKLLLYRQILKPGRMVFSFGAVPTRRT